MDETNADLPPCNGSYRCFVSIPSTPVYVPDAGIIIVVVIICCLHAGGQEFEEFGNIMLRQINACVV